MKKEQEIQDDNLAKSAATTPMHQLKSVRIVKVPRPQDVGLFADGPSVLHPMAKNYSTSPCAACNSVCCSEKVCINIVDLARLVLLLGVAPEDVIDFAPEHQSSLTIAPVINGQSQHMLLKQIEVPELDEPVCHMIARPGGKLRCGVHGVRPGICRAYPFQFYTDKDEFYYVGLPFLCPSSWALETKQRKAIEQEIVTWRNENDFAERAVKKWNREQPDDDVSSFFRYAIEKGARKLNLDPRPYLLANRKRGFSKTRLW